MLSNPTLVSLSCSVQPKAKRRGGPGGLNKLCGVSPELQVIVGQPALPRTEVCTNMFEDCFSLYVFQCGFQQDL